MEAGLRKTLVAAKGNGRGRHGQIKSRDRVRDLAEVYTHEREVNAMLDLVPDMFPSTHDPGNIDRIFLEPACGHGNFLVEILRRKLAFVVPQCYGHGEDLEHRALRCLASIYGIDICDDNVLEARTRMRSVINGHFDVYLGSGRPTGGFTQAVEVMLSTNVLCADTLAESGTLELVEYKPGNGGTFIREWSCPLDPGTDEPNLFSLPPRRDKSPVHYSELARQISPAVGDSMQRAA